MSHTRKVCPHDVVISQCRCIKSSGHATEVVRPCPFGSKHLGMVVVHPEPPVKPYGVPYPADLPGPRAVKQCVFRSCAWTIAEPDSLLAMAGLDVEIRAHLRTHRVEIELLAESIQ